MTFMKKLQGQLMNTNGFVSLPLPLSLVPERFSRSVVRGLAPSVRHGCDVSPDGIGVVQYGT
jgi:hypothetical protein